MAYRACLRCGSDDLRSPGSSDPDWEGSMTLNLVCRRCGNQGVPATFDDAASYHEFRLAREALWRPGNGHASGTDEVVAPGFPRTARPEARPARKRNGLTRGLFAVVGSLFLLAALGAFGTALGTGNLAALPSGVLALLLSVPLLVVAARRPSP